MNDMRRLMNDMQSRAQIYGAIQAERDRQDEQWGGPAHDDKHNAGDWMDYITHQVEKFAMGLMSHGKNYYATPDARQRFIKIAALCFAALESAGRKANDA